MENIYVQGSLLNVREYSNKFKKRLAFKDPRLLWRQ